MSRSIAWSAAAAAAAATAVAVTAVAAVAAVAAAYAGQIMATRLSLSGPINPHYTVAPPSRLSAVLGGFGEEFSAGIERHAFTGRCCLFETCSKIISISLTLALSLSSFATSADRRAA